MASVFKSEVRLARDSFHNIELKNDKVGLAQVIQNVLFIEKGTYPNQPDLGIGIENYLFEKIDKGTTSNLENDIKIQLKQFVPNDYIVEPKVESRVVNGNPTLLISFTIQDVEKKEETKFGFLVGQNKTTKNIVSKLIT